MAMRPLCECHGVEKLWHKDARRSRGGHWICAEKKRESDRRHYEQNREKVLKYQRQYYEQNREKVLKRQRQYQMTASRMLSQIRYEAKRRGNRG
jgi:hypothetical protein